MGGNGSRTTIQAIGLFLRNPGGLAISELADELGLTRAGARSRVALLQKEGVLEAVRGGRRGPGQEGIYRLAPEIRAAAMEAAQEWGRAKA